MQNLVSAMFLVVAVIHLLSVSGVLGAFSGGGCLPSRLSTRSHALDSPSLRAIEFTYSTKS